MPKLFSGTPQGFIPNTCCLISIWGARWKKPGTTTRHDGICGAPYSLTRSRPTHSTTWHLCATNSAHMPRLAAIGKDIWSSILTVPGRLTLAGDSPTKNKPDEVSFLRTLHSCCHELEIIVNSSENTSEIAGWLVKKWEVFHSIQRIPRWRANNQLSLTRNGITRV